MSPTNHQASQPGAARAVGPLLGAGLLGGFAAVRATHRREVGGLVLAAIGALAARLAWPLAGSTRTSLALLAYLTAFGGSHPLARKIGAWPAVAVVAVGAGVVGHLIAGRPGNAS